MKQTTVATRTRSMGRPKPGAVGHGARANSRIKTVSPLTHEPSPVVKQILPYFVLAVLVFLVFARVGTFEFTWWDDDVNVHQNLHVAHVGGNQLGYFWSTPEKGLFVPVVYTVWVVIGWFAQLPEPMPNGISLDAAPYHAANLVAHLASVLIVYKILQLLIHRRWPACAGAAVFALHPLQVEAVAWVTGLKEVLGGMFALSCIWQYVLFASARDRQFPANRFSDIRAHYALALLSLALGILCNPLASAAAAVSATIEWLFLRRSFRQVAASVLPLMVPVLVAGIISTRAQSLASVTPTPLWLRPIVALDALAFYLFKLMVPIRLTVDYARSPSALLEHGWSWWTWIIPVVATAGIFSLSRGRSWLLAGAAVFAAGLLPVLGFKSFSFQQFSTVADRYTYISLLGLALIVGGLLATMTSRPKTGFIGAVVVISGLASLSFHQESFWQNNLALWQHAYRVNPDSHVTVNNLADADRRTGRFDEALSLLKHYTTRWPDDLSLQDAIAVELLRRGRTVEAVPHMQKCIELQDRLAARADGPADIWNDNRTSARDQLAALLLAQRRYHEAEALLRQSLRINPSDEMARSLIRTMPPASPPRQ